MSERRKEKKSEMIEVRIPHSKKQAFMKACDEEGITASHAIRTFIDAYLKRSRRMKVKQVAQELSMTLIRNPIKTTGSIGAVTAALIAAFTLTAGPSAADRDAQPIGYPTPIYPEAMIAENMSADCEGRFDVTAKGYVVDLNVTCTHPGFVDSATQAIATLRFEPKIVNGEPVRRTGVVYPIQYQITPETEDILGPKDSN